MIFNGSSSFGADLQQTIDRAVAIASLPLVQLRSQKAGLEDRFDAIAIVNEQLTGLQAAIDAMSAAITTELHSAQVTDESIASVSLSGSVLPADYSLEVINLGARTLTLSLEALPVVADPNTESISSATEFTLTVDGNDFTITPAGGSLFELATAINSSGAGVQATVVNIGGTSGPDYRISIQSEAYSDVPIQLNDGSQDLLQTLANGTEVVYKVNGVPSAGISSTSRSVTFSPGLTVDLLNTGTTDILISESTSGLGDSLETFVTAYNAAVDGLDIHRGTDAGALSGQALLSSLSRSLSQISGFSLASGDIRSLVDLGIDLDDQGRLSFDRATLESKPVDQVLSFLGDPLSAGFLKTASDLIDASGDFPGGLIELEKASLQRQIDKNDDLIASNEQRIELMRENLTARMAAADAVLAVLEQQLLTITGLFEATRAAAKESG